MPPRIPILLSSAVAAVVLLATVPGSFADKGFFALTAHSFANPPFFITGAGTHENAYTLRTLRSSPEKPDGGDIPIEIAITDDPDNVFQASPPSPVDLAVILKNLRRLGKNTVAIGMPLAWPDPDIISLAALDQQLDSIPNLVTSTPLSRNPVPSPLPQAFRRASIPVSEVKGDTSLLPKVNRTSIPDVILGNKTSLAGFTTLESEQTTEFPHLIAVWDDRLLFSFHLLSVLFHFEKNPSDVRIHLGEFLSLGDTGPYLPIDEYGRLPLPNSSLPSSPKPSIRAERLIDAPVGFLEGESSKPVLIRNALSTADSASTRYSEAVVPTVSLLSDPSATSQAQTFPRVPWHAELLFLASLLSLIYGLGNYPPMRGPFPLAILAGGILFLHFSIVPLTRTWIPTLPALGAVLIAIPVARLNQGPRKKAVSMTTEQKKPETPARKTAKKAAKKTTRKTPRKAAKKTTKKTAKKTPAKKTSKKAAKKTARKSPAKKHSPKSPEP